jgi:hypothetical protein
MSTAGKKQRLEAAPTTAAAQHSLPTAAAQHSLPTAAAQHSLPTAAAQHSLPTASAPSGAAPEAAGSSSTTVDLWPLISDWVQAKRSAGATPAAVLDSLGLQLTREAATRDEDSVWAMVALVVAEYRQRLEPRRRLKEADTLEHVVQLLRSRSNVLVRTRPSTPDDSHSKAGSHHAHPASDLPPR